MSNKVTKLGVVLPTIGRPAELRRMLKSLAEQSQPPRQVIIVDEGKAGEYFAGEFPQLNIQILSMPGGSTSAKRNAGARAAARDITLIGFLDDDIVLEPGALEAMLTFWEQAPPAVGGAGFNLVNHPPLYASWLKSSRLASWLSLYSTEKGAVLRSGIHTLMGYLPDTTYVSWLNSGAAIYRKKVTEGFGFDDWFQGYSYLEDLDFSYRVGKKYKLAVVAGARFYHYPSPRGREDAYLFGKKEVVNRLHFVRKYRELSLFWCCFALLGRTFLSLTLGVSTRDMRHFKRAWGNCGGFLSLLTEGLGFPSRRRLPGIENNRTVSRAPVKKVGIVVLTASHFPLRPGAAARRRDNNQEGRDSEGDFVRQALRQLSRDGRSQESLVAGSADGISYAVVPSRKRPRYLIPLGNKRWTLSGLSIITPYVRRWRILKGLLVCLAKVGWNGWVRERVLVHPDQLRDLRKLVKEVTGEAQPIFALALGRPGRFRKLTVQVMCPDGSVLGYIKFPFTEAGTERVRHEAVVLDRLWTCPALHPHIPKVLHAGKWNDRFSLFLSPASGSPGPATFTPSHARFLQNLWSIYRVEKPGRVLVQKVSARWEMVAPSLNGQQRWLGNQALRWAGKWLEGTAVTCGVMHGDFAPGNICVKNNGELFVFDWELASWGEPIYWDVLNFRAVTSVIRGEMKFPMNWAPSSPRGSQTRQAVRLLYLVDSLCSLLKEGREGRERAIEYRFKWLERFASDGGQRNNSKNARSENYQLSHMR